MEQYQYGYQYQDARRDKPYVIVGLAVILVLVTFVLERMGNTEDAQFMLSHGALYWEKVKEGEYYRIFTAMFLHFGVEHLVNNVAMMLIIGCQLEILIGHVKTAAVFLLSGIFGNICSFVYCSVTNSNSVCAGASGAIYGLMGALCVLLALSNFSRSGRGRINGVGARVIVLLFLVFYGSVSQPQIDVAAHVGGLIGGFLLAGMFWICQKGRGRYERNY